MSVQSKLSDGWCPVVADDNREEYVTVRSTKVYIDYFWPKDICVGLIQLTDHTTETTTYTDLHKFYFQVDFQFKVAVTGVVTRGYKNNWVQDYQMEYSDDYFSWIRLWPGGDVGGVSLIQSWDKYFIA